MEPPLKKDMYTRMQQSGFLRTVEETRKETLTKQRSSYLTRLVSHTFRNMGTEALESRRD